MGGRSLRLPRRLSEPIAVASNRFTDLIIFNFQTIVALTVELVYL